MRKLPANLQERKNFLASILIRLLPLAPFKLRPSFPQMTAKRIVPYQQTLSFPIKMFVALFAPCIWATKSLTTSTSMKCTQERRQTFGFNVTLVQIFIPQKLYAICISPVAILATNRIDKVRFKLKPYNITKLPTSPGTIQAEVKLTMNDRREDCAPPTSSFTAEKNVCCAFCPMQSGDKKSYYQHVNEMHVAEVADIWFQCGICPNFYPTEVIRNMHYCYCKQSQSRRGLIQTEALQRSNVSSSIGSNQDDSVLDQEKCATTPTNSSMFSKTFSCQFCPAHGFGVRAYYIHVNSAHRDVAAKIWFKCEYCFRCQCYKHS